MVMQMKKNPKRVVTLQHDDNGKIRLLCKSCNSQHASVGDRFYKQPVNMKVCADCKKNLPNEMFYKSRTNKTVRLTISFCKDCWRVRYREWRLKNKESINKKYREWRNKNKIRLNIYQNERRRKKQEEMRYGNQV
jgi:hypothetical protein